MSWAVTWAAAASRDMRQLDPPIRKRVSDAVEKFALKGQGDVRKLVGTDELRLRVGDWRVRFRYRHERNEIEIVRVDHRREAYR